MRKAEVDTRGSPARFVDAGTVVQAGDWVSVQPLQEAQALEQADERFRSFIRLYLDRVDGPAEAVPHQFSARELLASGMSGRLARLRPAAKGAHRLPGQGFVYESIPQGAHALSRPLVAQGLSQRFLGVCMLRRPDFFLLTGRVGEDFLYLVAAALPLRGQQGEVSDILLPFFDKVGDIPGRLCEEFFTRDV
jgi:hypothetical protein